MLGNAVTEDASHITKLQGLTSLYCVIKHSLAQA